MVTLSEVLTMRVVSRRMAAVLLMSLLSLASIAPPIAAQSEGRVSSGAIRDAVAHARTMPEAFGGVWIVDEGAVFAFTHRATDEQIAEVLDLVRPGTRVATVRVESSEAELRSTYEAIRDAVSAGELTFVTGIGTAIQQNAVVVSIVPELYEVCQTGLLARFGSVRLLFEPSAGDVGTQTTDAPSSTAAPSGSPAEQPPGCLPPPSSSQEPGSPPSESPAPMGSPAGDASPVPTTS